MLRLLTQSLPYVVGPSDKAHGVSGLVSLWCFDRVAEHWIWGQETQAGAAGLTFPSCVTLGKSPNLLEPFPLI